MTTLLDASMVANLPPGGGGGAAHRQTFVAGVDYLPGANSLTLDQSPVDSDSLLIYFDAFFQQSTEYTVSGTVVTFSDTIPTSVAQVEVIFGVPTPDTPESQYHFDNILALKQSTAPDTLQTGFISGYYSESDGGEGHIYWDRHSNERDNGGTVFALPGVAVGRWKRVLNEGQMTAKMFGALGTDTDTTLQSWIDQGLYPSFAALKLSYPDVVATTDQVDWAAIQECVNQATAKRMKAVITGGSYLINNEIDTPSNCVIEWTGDAMVYAISHSRTGALFTNVGKLPKDRVNITLNNPRIDGSRLPFTGTVRANDNAIGFATGAKTIRVSGGLLRGFKANHFNGPGGKGFGCEQGAEDIVVNGTTIEDCSFATFTSSHIEDPTKNIKGVVFMNLKIRKCGVAAWVMGHAVEGGVVPVTNPDVCSAAWLNCYVENTGYHPDREIGGRREKTGVFVVSGASNITVRNMVVRNNSGFPNATYPAGGTNWPTAWPPYSSGACGGGLSGPIGAVLWGWGRNIDIEMTYDGDCDDLWQIALPRAMGQTTFGGRISPIDAYNMRVKIKHSNGSCINTIKSGIVSRSANLVSATSTTVNLEAGYSERDNDYVGSILTLTGGTGTGQSRSIIAYDGTTKVATVETAWVTVPDSTTVANIGSTSSISDTFCNGSADFEVDTISSAKYVHSSARFPTKLRYTVRDAKANYLNDKLSVIYTTYNDQL